jgi:hypothetical protein
MPPSQTDREESVHRSDQDYADFPSLSTSTTSGFTTIVGIIRTSA